MTQEYDWQYDLDEYIRQGEADRAEKSAAWQTAIGLQDVDGLQTSDYLLETAKEHIEGKIDIATAQKRIRSYYEQRNERLTTEQDTMEADIVASRIAELLAEKTFQFSPAELQSIHRRLFAGVFKSAGQYRTYNITKKEWVLNSNTVFYAAYDSIRDTLDYDFNQEKEFSYERLDAAQAIKHIAKFISDIWQIHPFCEGNTRTTAVFMIKYLQTFGFSVSNQVFADNSWYFRNALVRANYNDLQNNIHATTVFLEQFIENLLTDANHDLKNRYMHVDYTKNSQSANSEISKCKNCTLEELAILKEIANNPSITQKSLAEAIGKSERTVKSRTVELQEKGLIRRKNGKRNGQWEVLVEI
ncbi:MAG: Fic family protein [Ruminococcus flavefaciens]|nr:Fic family protein [Ruminococcus flavefaciens]MCM1362482.1 Fic family protein [Clostridiales bacterium]